MEKTPDQPGTLEQWIERLKEGDVEFYTRYLDEEWGCCYLGESRFLVWSRRVFEDLKREDILDHPGMVSLFSRYSLERLWGSLIQKRA